MNLVVVQGNEHPPVLLVDGYNVLHKYTDFMREAQPSHDVVAAHFEEQRSLLEATLISYSQKHGIKVVIAYDAINRPPDPVYVDIRTSTRLAFAMQCHATGPGLVVWCCVRKLAMSCLTALTRTSQSCPHKAYAS